MHCIAFASGFAIETACVYWVHYSERGRAGATALCSMLVAAAQILGIGDSLHSPSVACCYVAGFGAGTYLAVRRKGQR